MASRIQADGLMVIDTEIVSRSTPSKSASMSARTSMPASLRHRATTLTPRSWPSSPTAAEIRRDPAVLGRHLVP
jgi:hypothetical protein